MKNKILFSLFFVIFLSCENRKKEINKELNIYYSDSIKVDKNNIPLDENQSYAPEEIKIDVLSAYLFQIREPLLFNKPSKREIFRLTWLRSFHNPIVINIIKKDNHYTVIRKESKRDSIRKEASEILKDLSTKNKNEFFNIYRKHTYVDSKLISKKEWLKLIDVADSINFWNMEAGNEIGGFDGSMIYLEYSSNQGYKIVEKWSPEEESLFYKIFSHIIELSDLKIPKDEIY